jgi:hypothetical protein
MNASVLMINNDGSIAIVASVLWSNRFEMTLGL